MMASIWRRAQQRARGSERAAAARGSSAAARAARMSECGEA